MMRMLWVMMGMFVPFVAPSLTLRRCPCVGAYRALCARCAKSRPFSTTGRQFFGCRIAAGY